MLTFTYDSSDDLSTAACPTAACTPTPTIRWATCSSDSWGTRSTTYTYDPTRRTEQRRRGAGRTEGLVPASIQGLQTTPAQSASRQGMAVETDPLGRVTTYTLRLRSVSPPRSRRPTEASKPGSATSPASPRPTPMNWAA